MPRNSNLQSDRLSKLEERKKKLHEQILREKNELRDRSKGRAVVRARALGEVLMRLAQDGRLDDRLFRMLKDGLWAHVDPGSPQFESLNGTAFDLSERLHDMSIAVQPLLHAAHSLDRGMSQAAVDAENNLPMNVTQE